MKSLAYTLSILLISLFAMRCSDSSIQDQTVHQQPDTTTYTSYSKLKNRCQGFDSPRAINAIADLENEHFRLYKNDISPYYGTTWREYTESSAELMNEENIYQKYVDDLGAKGDSMHCTIYAVRALEAGMDSLWEPLEEAHRRVYKEHEHAGWSLGYLLVKEFGWKAYIIIDSASKEFNQCVKAYQRHKHYPVWRQPNIPLEGMFIRDNSAEEIRALMNQHEFGWGFSHQGIHTWISRFDMLKECNWMGAPGAKYEVDDSFSWPLFMERPFEQYYDYASHVIVFPPLLPDKNG